MTLIASHLAAEGWVLRTGAANGADTAFEQGHRLRAGDNEPEVYLPWRNFNGHKSPLYNFNSAEAKLIASRVAENWGVVKPSTRNLFTRNVHQVLGVNLNEPSKFVCCWTKNGEEVGGTRIAIRIAKQNNIPVINLFNKTSIEEVYKQIRETK